jgi:hypothetical protein
MGVFLVGTIMMKSIGQRPSQQLTSLQQSTAPQSMYDPTSQNQQGLLRTDTLLGGSANSFDLKPGQVWKMGAAAQQQQNPIGAAVSIFKTGNGEIVITGDKILLREYFESDPEQWLRCLALKGTKNGKTKK